MATTELSLSATPGKPHTFLAKAPAIIPEARMICATIDIFPRVDGAGSISPAVESTFTIKKC